jgi:hypothetical protein
VVAVLAVGSAAVLTLDRPGGDEVVLQEPDGSQASPEASPTPTPTSPSVRGRDPDPDARPGGDPDAQTDGADDGSPPAFEGRTSPYERAGAPDQQIAVLSSVRVGVHEGYDRVVWEFSEGDRPRVRVEYVDQPRQPGSGEPVAVAGDAHLRLMAEFATDRGAELYASDAEGYDGPQRVDGAGTAAVAEVVALGDFEANLQWAVGLDRQRPFRVTVLEAPLRIVVDVAH